MVSVCASKQMLSQTSASFLYSTLQRKNLWGRGNEDFFFSHLSWDSLIRKLCQSLTKWWAGREIWCMEVAIHKFTHIAEKLLFSMLPSILTFNFDLIFGLFLAFLGPKLAIFGIFVRLKNVFWVYSYSWMPFIFYAPLQSYF